MANIKNTNDEQLKLYTASLMLTIASADDLIEESEIGIISNILCDFYNISKNRANELITEAKIFIIQLLQIIYFEFVNPKKHDKKYFSFIFLPGSVFCLFCYF